MVGLDAAGDSAVEEAGIRVDLGAAPGDPDHGRSFGRAHVACEMGAAAGDAKEGGGVAFDLDKGSRTHDAEVLAV